MVLRLVLPSLTVLFAGWVQQRLGPRHSGRLIGLPLTSGPFLAVLLLIEGPEITVTAARGVATGQLMVVTFAATYAALTVARWRPTSALLGGTSLVAALGAAIHAWLPWHAAFVVPFVAGLVLLGWRPEQAQEQEQQTAVGQLGSSAGDSAPVRGLLARGVLTGGLVAGLSLAAPLLGPSLAGLLASIPLVVAVLAPSAHARNGAATARTLLRGTLAVVPGTAAFALVIATALQALEPVAAFGLAMASLATLNWLVGAADGAAQKLRMP